MVNNSVIIVANSKFRFDKWKAFGKGKIKASDMILLAQTYYDEISKLLSVLKLDSDKMTDTEIFNLVSKHTFNQWWSKVGSDLFNKEIEQVKEVRTP